MLMLSIIAIAPVFIILAYIYYRDKYEKEPLRLLLEGLLAGAFIVLPIIFFERKMGNFAQGMDSMASAAWNAFMVASFVEETFKLFAVLFLVWRNINFNEKMDGIVYAVFVSLGFALVENIMYVLPSDGGLQVGLMRAFTAVPAHAMFGVMMGYWLGKARFAITNRKRYMLKAFFIPFLFHGFYDFILMSQKPYLLALFVPLLLYMFYRSRKRIKAHQDQSFFTTNNSK